MRGRTQPLRTPDFHWSFCFVLFCLHRAEAEPWVGRFHRPKSCVGIRSAREGGSLELGPSWWMRTGKQRHFPSSRAAGPVAGVADGVRLAEKGACRAAVGAEPLASRGWVVPCEGRFTSAPSPIQPAASWLCDPGQVIAPLPNLACSLCSGARDKGSLPSSLWEQLSSLRGSESIVY